MDTIFYCAFTFVLFLLADLGESAEFKVTAEGDSDISPELLKAWDEACAATTPSIIVIPKGTFQMKQALLKGPCKAPIELKIKATLKAPPNPNDMECKKEWLTINYVDDFTLSGDGTLDGQGDVQIYGQKKDTGFKSDKLPNNLSLNFLKNSIIRDITSLNSKLFHVNVFGGKNLTFQKITIKAPADSHNTDGIHIAKICDVTIKDSVIGTGDDCISIGDGLENLNIDGVTCGPGHGISVGSLGKTPGEEPVKGVTVKDSKFIGTDNGLRIKTWPNSHPGVVTDIHYHKIEMEDVKNPIVIDQEYCPNNQCSKEKPSLVKISNVSYTNIKGTSATEEAVIIACSSGVPCEDVKFGDINLTFKGGAAKTVCSNAKPKLTGKQTPPVTCK
ncbi:PREDICTED: polygalacturonase-like [Ipomoea nil]|uniref:polygalacturonase-like n=1 Tax=Ipomoea nil TaxID=35883 RepID=UPI000900DF3E|nr:PREDICTED: polygalacturonase-like [Ipomoea nil]XP_019164651.1 PREDICTED: polygalacturonase-like [Ipomoea nil]XP_019165061.1 PREDICTED: polygalacturonase-like [Ipomoea nil]